MSGWFGSCRSERSKGGRRNVYSGAEEDSNSAGSCGTVSVWSKCSNECFTVAKGVENGLLACTT